MLGVAARGRGKGTSVSMEVTRGSIDDKNEVVDAKIGKPTVESVVRNYLKTTVPKWKTAGEPRGAASVLWKPNPRTLDVEGPTSYRPHMRCVKRSVRPVERVYAAGRDRGSAHPSEEGGNGQKTQRLKGFCASDTAERRAKPGRVVRPAADDP